jgi:hypothetical protein
LPEILVEYCMHPLCLHPLWVMKCVWYGDSLSRPFWHHKVGGPNCEWLVMTGLILVMLLLVLLELTEWLTFQVLLWSFVWNPLDMFLSGCRECSESK